MRMCRRISPSHAPITPTRVRSKKAVSLLGVAFILFSCLYPYPRSTRYSTLCRSALPEHHLAQCVRSQLQATHRRLAVVRHLCWSGKQGIHDHGSPVIGLLVPHCAPAIPPPIVPASPRTASGIPVKSAPGIAAPSHAPAAPPPIAPRACYELDIGVGENGG